MTKTNWKKNTIMFLTSQAITLFGSSLVQYAVTWYVARETQSGLMVALMILFGFLPQVAISLFAGVWADRYSRKMMIILSDGGIAVATLLLAFVVMNTTDFYPALLIISAIRSLGAGIQTPAVNATIPQLVPQDKLMRVSGINGSIMSAINLVAPMSAGAILSYGAIHHIMFIDIITAIIGIFLLLFVPLAKHNKAIEQKKGGYFDDLKAGVKYTIGNKFLRRVLIVSAVFFFLLAPASMLNVLFVTRIFGDNYWLLTFNELAFFVGMLVGGLVIGAWGGFSNRLKTLGWGAIVFGSTVIAIGFIDVFWMYLVVMVVCGFSVPFNNAPMMVMIQEKVEPDMQGRVFSLLQIVTTFILPLAMSIFGPAADIIPIQWIMIASGVALLIMSAFIFGWKSFYNVGENTITF